MMAGSWRDRRWEDAREHLRSARALVDAAMDEAGSGEGGGEDAVAVLRHVRAAAEILDRRLTAERPRSAGAEDEATGAGSVRLSVRRDVTVGTEGLVTLRAWVRETLDEWRVDRATAGAAIDVAHELASNALQHAAPPVWIELELRDGSVDVVVHDGDHRPAVLRPYRAGVSDSGLGLHLVRHLASTWGQDDEGSGKRVWARVTREQRSGGPAKRARAAAMPTRRRPERAPR